MAAESGTINVIFKDAIDSRAVETLRELTFPFFFAVQKALDHRHLIRAILNNLPYGMASVLELKLVLQNRREDWGLNPEKAWLTQAAAEVIQSAITAETPFKSISREAVVDWYFRKPDHQKYLIAPREEIFEVTLPDANETMVLTEEQLMGLIYGLYAMGITDMKSDSPVMITSNITNEPVEIQRLIDNATAYQRPIELATERLRRPYHVDLIMADGVLPLYFQTPQFMQGLISVAAWYGLEDRGRDILWTDLTRFSREGDVPLHV